LTIAQNLAENCEYRFKWFGEASAIEAERARFEKDYGVKVIYNAADTTKPD
jgi:hypothetical protein